MVNVKTEIIDEIIEVAKRMDRLGLMNAFSGNISVHDEGLYYVTPTGKSKANYTRDMICVLDEDGNQVAGSYKPTSEFKMHKGVYPMRSDIKAIIHTHSPFLSAYAVCGKDFMPDSYAEAIMMGGAVVAPYGQPGTDAIYAGVEPLIQNHNCILLKNHGVLAVGESLTSAANRAECFEAAAKVMTIANMIGTPDPICEEELAKIR